MNNIFKNAYFGKPYKTRDGRKAIFICKRTDNSVWDLNRPYACVVEGFGKIWNYFPNGQLYLGEKFVTEKMTSFLNGKNLSTKKNLIDSLMNFLSETIRKMLNY